MNIRRTVCALIVSSSGLAALMGVLATHGKTMVSPVTVSSPAGSEHLAGMLDRPSRPGHVLGNTMRRIYRGRGRA